MSKRRFKNPDVESFWSALEEGIPQIMPWPIFWLLVILGVIYQMFPELFH